MRKLFLFSLLQFNVFMFSALSAQTLFENEKSEFSLSGYSRTGVGRSKGSATQAHFQMPGALNKYNLGNQADTYGELQFSYTHFLNDDKSKSLDVVWMTSIYEDFGSRGNMAFNFTEQLYLRANNLLGWGETIWGGNRFYDRRAIHMLDRQWINPGQKGWGFGIENLLKKDSAEDLKFAAWRFKNKDVVSFINNEKDNLYNYTADVRWVHKPLSETLKLNMALNYSYRASNEKLGYEAKHGFGIFSWLDYNKANITNTTALLFRQGANVSTDHWSGMSYTENMTNTNLVTSDLSGAYSLELNNEFLYDDHDRWAVNFITMAVARNYGTKPYNYVDGEKQYIEDKGKMMYWLTAGARSSYYLSKYFRLTFEYTHEYIDNRQLDARGHLNRLTFTPELTLKKGMFSRPSLRPFISYSQWSDSLRGHIGHSPNGAPYAKATSGFNYGLQFEIWW